MIETLEYGKSYAIYLNELYGGYKQNVRIIGKTNIDNVISNSTDDYNIYQTYFEPVGLGLTSYYSAIKTSTVIYIGLVVDSLEPYSYTETKVFIPETLIDFDKSEEYMKVTKLTYTIFPVVRKFGTDDDKDAFITSSKESVLNRIKGLIEFTNLDTELTVSSSDFYVTKEEYQTLDDAREEAYKEYRQRMTDSEDAKREQEALYNAKLASLDQQIAQYKLKVQEMENTKNKYQGLIDQLTT